MDDVCEVCGSAECVRSLCAAHWRYGVIPGSRQMLCFPCSIIERDDKAVKRNNEICNRRRCVLRQCRKLKKFNFYEKSQKANLPWGTRGLA